MTNVHDTLKTIQQKLKVPKSQFNDFGKYKYRSCEDIVEAVKPLLGDCLLILSDSIECAEGRVFIKATASIMDAERTISANGFAREPLSKKGMDESQITGSASSYARKYALNGLFGIDDTKDADTEDNSDKGVTPAPSAPARPAAQNGELPWLNELQFKAMLKKIEEGEGRFVREAMSKYRMKKIWKEELLTTLNLHEESHNEEVDPEDIPF